MPSYERCTNVTLARVHFSQAIFVEVRKFFHEFIHELQSFSNGNSMNNIHFPHAWSVTEMWIVKWRQHETQNVITWGIMHFWNPSIWLHQNSCNRIPEQRNIRTECEITFISAANFCFSYAVHRRMSALSSRFWPPEYVYAFTLSLFVYSDGKLNFIAISFKLRTWFIYSLISLNSFV